MLAREYGIGSEREVTSPYPVSAIYSEEKQSVTVEFTNVGAGLIAAGHSPMDSVGMAVRGFTLGDYDHRTDADATIISRCAVEIAVPSGAPHDFVAFALRNRVPPDTATLRNGANLPCPTFLIPIQ